MLFFAPTRQKACHCEDRERDQLKLDAQGHCHWSQAQLLFFILPDMQFPSLIFEREFFVNIFLKKPEAYICTGNISADGFAIAGACGSEAYQQNGIDYSPLVLKVFLPGRNLPGRQSR